MSIGRTDETNHYSKEEILQLIEQTKEKYGFSDMTDLGDILGEYNHNWYYYYKNKAKKAPAFLETLLAVQNPFEMFERMRQRTLELMKQNNMTTKDMHMFCFYIKRMIFCVTLLGDQLCEEYDQIKGILSAAHEESQLESAVNAWVERMTENIRNMLFNAMYITQLVLYMEEHRVQSIQEEINARNKGKESFDLIACFEAHRDTPAFKLGRMKSLSKEEEKETCWYKVRCSSIKKCRVYEYGKKLENLQENRDKMSAYFRSSAKELHIQEEEIKLFENVYKLLQELELPEI